MKRRIGLMLALAALAACTPLTEPTDAQRFGRWIVTSESQGDDRGELTIAPDGACSFEFYDAAARMVSEECFADVGNSMAFVWHTSRVYSGNVSELVGPQGFQVSAVDRRWDVLELKTLRLRRVGP